MSVESAKAFLEKFNSDEAFKKTIEAAKTDEARQAVVKKAGFKFTKADLKSAFADQGKQELSEDDLESVAGGASATWVSTGATAGGAIAAAL